MRGTPEERFWGKVDRRGPDECWEWLGKTNPRGMGLFSVGEKYSQKLAARISLEFVGRFPAKLAVLQFSCNNTKCVNPNHLAERNHFVEFWNKVDKRGADECWLWLGGLNNKGYGVVTINNKKTLMLQDEF